jgi:hypothetical protein
MPRVRHNNNSNNYQPIYKTFINWKVALHQKFYSIHLTCKRKKSIIIMITNNQLKIINYYQVKEKMRPN